MSPRSSPVVAVFGGNLDPDGSYEIDGEYLAKKCL